MSLSGTQPGTGPIPKRLIQTAKTANLPLLGRASAVNLRLLNPDFEYCFFDDAQAVSFIAAEYPEYLETFHGFPYPIQRFDFFRYLAVYRLGGFYLDTDVLLVRGLEGLRGCGCVFPFEELTLNPFLRQRLDADWELGNYAFGAAPGHPFLKQVIENCARAQREPGFAREMLAGVPGLFRRQFEVLYTTGPGLVTRTLLEAPELQAGLTVLFPHDVRDAGSWHQFGDYGIHLMQASWRGQGGYWRVRLGRLWETRRRRWCERCSEPLGPQRRGRWHNRYPEGAGGV